jgi:hypothetical protein
MQDGKQLKYGQISGGEQGFFGLMAASQTIRAASGKFVYRTGASTATLTMACDGTTELLGHAEVEAKTTAATDGMVKVVCDLTAVFRIPVNSGTYARTMKGKTCDISISSYVQGAQLDASAEDTLIIVDGDEVNNLWVDVMINPAKVGATGVA